MFETVIDKFCSAFESRDREQDMKQSTAIRDSQSQTHQPQRSVGLDEHRVTPAIPPIQFQSCQQSNKGCPDHASGNSQGASAAAALGGTTAVHGNPRDVKLFNPKGPEQSNIPINATRGPENLCQTLDVDRTMNNYVKIADFKSLLHENRELKKESQQLREHNTNLQQINGPRYEMRLADCQNLNAQLNAQLNAEHRAKEHAEYSFQSAGKQIEKLKSDLEDCKAQIFKLNPIAQTNDKQVLEQYHQLCESITDWTHSTFGDLDLGNFLARMNKAQADPRTRAVMDRYLLHEGHAKIFTKYPSAELSMIMWLSFRHFEHHLLEEEEQFTGYGADISDGVEILEDLKRFNGASRDQIKLWRADLQAAVQSRKELQEEYTSYLRRISRWIYPYVEAILRSDQKQASVHESFHKLTKEAAELSKLFGRSFSSYRLQYDFFPNSSVNHRYFYDDMINHYKLVDVGTGQDIRSSSSFHADEDGKIGTMLGVIFPALVREATESAEEIELEKATVLLKTDRPIIKCGRGKTHAEASSRGKEMDSLI